MVYEEYFCVNEKAPLGKIFKIIHRTLKLKCRTSLRYQSQKIVAVWNSDNSMTRTAGKLELHHGTTSEFNCSGAKVLHAWDRSIVAPSTASHLACSLLILLLSDIIRRLTSFPTGGIRWNLMCLLMPSNQHHKQHGTTQNTNSGLCKISHWRTFALLI